MHRRQLTPSWPGELWNSKGLYDERYGVTSVGGDGDHPCRRTTFAVCGGEYVASERSYGRPNSLQLQTPRGKCPPYTKDHRRTKGPSQ